MNTNKFLKISVVLLGLFLLACLTGVWWVNHSFTPEKIKPLLEAGFSEFLQRDLEIKEVSWVFRPRPALKGKGIVLKDAEGQVMAGCPEVLMDLSFMELWKGKINVRNLVFSRSRINLWKTTEGSNSLNEMIRDIRLRLEKKKEEGASAVRFAVERIVLDEASVKIYEWGFDQSKRPLQLIMEGSGTFEKTGDVLSFPFFLEGAIETEREPIPVKLNGSLSRDPRWQVQVKSFPVEELRRYWPEAAGLNGRANFSFRYNRASESQWSLGFNTGAIQVSTAAPVAATLLSGELNQNAPSSLSVTLRGRRLQAESDLSFFAIHPATVTASLKAENLDLQELLTWFDALKPYYGVRELTGDESGYFSDFTLDGDLKNVFIRAVKVDRLRTTLTRQNGGELRFDPILAQGLGGQGEGRFVLVLPEKGKSGVRNPAVFRSSFTLTKVSMGPLMESTGLNIQVKGRSDWQGILSGPLGSAANGRLNGRVKAEMTNGVILNAPVLLKSLSRLNLTSLLESVDGSATKGFPVDRGEVTAIFKDGKIYFDPPSRIENRTVHIGFEGQVDPVAGVVKGRMVFRFLSVLKEVLSVIPGLGTVVYGNQKSLVPVYMDVTGPVANPEFTARPLQSAAKTIQNTFKRLLGIPLDGLGFSSP